MDASLGGITDAVSALGVIVGAVLAFSISYLRLRWERTRWYEEHPDDEGPPGLSFQTFLSEWSAILGEVEALFDTSVIDRFLVLEGTNGKEKIVRVTAFFQLRAEGQYPYPYKNYRIDDYYRRLLSQAERNESGVYVETMEMPESGLKRIYEAEGVTSSVLHYLSSEMVGDNTRELIFCSFATHEGSLNESDLTRIEIVASRMRVLCESGRRTEQ